MRRLFGAFPLAYAVIVDALTIPLTAMLIGLIFRGVAFEFRFKATGQAAHLGQGVHRRFPAGDLQPGRGGGRRDQRLSGERARRFAGSALDWLTPFTLFCGVGLVVAYALLGCTWLMMKTEGTRCSASMPALATPAGDGAAG